MGGMTSLAAFMRYKRETPLGGIFGLSTVRALEAERSNLSDEAKYV